VPEKPPRPTRPRLFAGGASAARKYLCVVGRRSRCDTPGLARIACHARGSPFRILIPLVGCRRHPPTHNAPSATTAKARQARHPAAAVRLVRAEYRGVPRAPRGVPGASRRGARGARRAAQRGAVVQRRREERRCEERRREERLRSDFVCLMRFILIKNEIFDSSLDLRSRRSEERREERRERREE